MGKPSRGPGLARAVRTTELRARSEAASASIVNATLSVASVERAGGSNRAIAQRLGVDERVVRDWRAGQRAIPLWAVLALPAERASEVLRAALALIESHAAHAEVDAHLRRMAVIYGDATAALDAALADGHIDDRERHLLAMLFRRLEARAAAAAHDLDSTGTG